MSVTLHGPDGSGRPANEAAAPQAERPSERIINKANSIREVTDAQGRVIRFRKLGALDMMDLTELAGSQNAQNGQWMVFAMIAFSVTEIDGDRVMRPQNKAQLRALVSRLGDEGIDAVYAEVMPKEGDGTAQTHEVERAKNS